LGNHVCHTWGGSTTWSSTLMIRGSCTDFQGTGGLTLASGNEIRTPCRPRGGRRRGRRSGNGPQQAGLAQDRGMLALIILEIGVALLVNALAPPRTD
jgi:hypothetical protein